MPPVPATASITLSDTPFRMNDYDCRLKLFRKLSEAQNFRMLTPEKITPALGAHLQECSKRVEDDESRAKSLDKRSKLFGATAH